MLENSYKHYIDSEPLDNGIVNLENGYQVWQQSLLVTVEHK